MKLWTAQYRYSGPDRLDITVKGQNRIGKVFAPTWDMVKKYKSGEISNEEYIKLYKSLMIQRCATDFEAWDWILSQDEVTIVCFCKKNTFCHRYLLAKILVELGARYMGER